MSDLLLDAFVTSRRAPDPDLLETAHERARLTQILLGVYGACLIGGSAFYALVPLYTGIVPDVVIGIAFVSTAVAFARWKMAAYRITEPLSGAPTERSLGWAAGGYFIPFANLYIPYQIMREIAEAADPADLGVEFGERRSIPVGLWWALWILMSVGGRIASRMSPEAGGESLAVGLFFLGVLAVTLGATAAAFVVVRRVDEGQQEMADLLATIEARAEPEPVVAG